MKRFVLVIATLALAACDRDPTGLGAPLESPTQLSLSTASSAPISAQVGVGGLHACAVKTDGDVVCWANLGFSPHNDVGQLTPPAGLKARQVSLGTQHSCALKVDGTVACWGGENLAGNDYLDVPSDLRDVTQVSTGDVHSCALKSDGTVRCWGWDGNTQAFMPAGLNNVTQIAVGSAFACALKADGTVVCWGSEKFERTRNSSPPEGLNSVRQISAGGDDRTACALKTDGTVVCWGDNGHETYIQQVPADLGDVVQLTSGAFHGCVLRRDGTVRCWGGLDDGWAWPVNAKSGSVPPGLTSVVQIDAGRIHTCAVKADGAVVCWADRTDQPTVPAGLNLITNKAPVASVGGPYSGSEGSAVAFNGSTSADPDGDALTYAWDFGDGTTGSGVNPSHTYADNGTYTVTLRVSDGSLSHSSSTTATVVNVAPAVGTITAPIAPVAVGTAVNVSASFSDAGTLDTHTAVIDWDATGTSTPGSAAVTESGGTGSVLGSHTYTAAGVYTVKITLSDKDGGAGTSLFQYVVVYDSEAGFVTGGGWINSPLGAYAADPALTGQANFGFVSRYQKGATTPSGQTEFQFRAGSLNFHSSSYEWLVISGPKAQYKGTGTINGKGSYGFIVTANDGQVNGGGGVDKFRIKITDKATGQVVYDNQMGEAEDAGATTGLGGGSITIQSK